MRKWTYLFFIIVFLALSERAKSEDDPALLEEPFASDSIRATSDPTVKADTVEEPQSYILSFFVDGEINFSPKDDARAGGLLDVDVTYRLMVDIPIPTVKTKQSLQAVSKIESNASGYLFNSNDIACQLRLQVADADTDVTIIPKSGSAPRELQLKISWPNKIEERWESFCPISFDRSFVTSGEIEMPFAFLLKHSDPPLSSFVVIEDKNGIFTEEFNLENLDESSDPTYAIGGSGNGRIVIAPSK